MECVKCSYCYLLDSINSDGTVVRKNKYTKKIMETSTWWLDYKGVKIEDVEEIARLEALESDDALVDCLYESYYNFLSGANSVNSLENIPTTKSSINIAYTPVPGEQSIINFLPGRALDGDIYNLVITNTTAEPSLINVSDSGFFEQTDSFPIEITGNEVLSIIFLFNGLTYKTISSYSSHKPIPQDYVEKAGDTMTGPLYLSGDPTEDMMAATRKFVLDSVANAETTGLEFKGYISMTEPTQDLREGNLWYQPAMIENAPDTNFPWQVKAYTSGAWSSTTTEYTPDALDMWTNLDLSSGGSSLTKDMRYYKEVIPYTGSTEFSLIRMPVEVLEVRVLKGDEILRFLRTGDYSVSGNIVTVDSTKLDEGAEVAVYYVA